MSGDDDMGVQTKEPVVSRIPLLQSAFLLLATRHEYTATYKTDRNEQQVISTYAGFENTFVVQHKTAQGSAPEALRYGSCVSRFSFTDAGANIHVEHTVNPAFTRAYRDNFRQLLENEGASLYLKAGDRNPIVRQIVAHLTKMLSISALKRQGLLRAAHALPHDDKTQRYICDFVHQNIRQDETFGSVLF